MCEGLHTIKYKCITTKLQEFHASQMAQVTDKITFWGVGILNIVTILLIFLVTLGGQEPFNKQLIR